MKTKHWNSDIITFQDDNSYSLLSANKQKGWFLTLGYLLLTVGLVLLYFFVKWLSLAIFLKITIFFLFALFFLSIKIITSIPVGTDTFLYLTDKEFRYQFYHLGYTEITHPIRAITKVSLSSNDFLLKFQLHGNRVTETIEIPIKLLSEANIVLQEIHTFLEQQGVHLPPPVIIPSKK